MRLLVTGAAGFIGSNFVHYWLERHPDDSLVALDLLTYAGNRANLAGTEERVPFVQADIADIDLVENVLLEHEIDVVVNFAAESHNSLAVVDPGLFARTNVLGTQLLLEAARKSEVERFHHISTCEVYGDLPLDSDESFSEESPYRPRTPYNASKAAADHYVRAYRETFGVQTTITNCSNNYGPFQFPEKVIPLFVTNALDDRPLPMYSSTQNKREWLHVRDHCRAIELVLTSGEPGETYNVGSGIEASIEEIADSVLELTGKPESLKTIVPDRPGHDRRYLLDSSKLRRELAWEPEIDFEAACERRSSGTPRTGAGGSRSASACRSKKPPGANSPVQRQTLDMSRPSGRRPLDAGHSAQEPWPHGTCWASDTGHVRCRRLRHARRPSRQCGSSGAPRSLRRTELAGRGAGRPSSAVVIRRTRQSRPASSKIASANSAHVHSPPAATWYVPCGSSRTPVRRFREMADERRRAALVVDDRHLVLLRAELEHRPHEVLARPAEEPRGAHDPALANLVLALELRPPVDRQGPWLVGLDVRPGLRAVEDVVRREVDDGRAESNDVASPLDVHLRRPFRIDLRAVDVGPGRRVEHQVTVCYEVGLGARDVPVGPRERVGGGKRLGKRGAELPAGAGDQDAAWSRSDRIGDLVLHRSTTRGSFHGTSCSSGSPGSYSSVTW